MNADIPPLDMHELPAFLPAAEQVLVIYSYQVCKKLQKLNPYKAMGPDNIPPRLLKEFAYELAEPIADLFNLSLSSCMVWYGMVWYGMVWYGMVWYGMVWYGMVWYGMVWYGMVWYDMIWYGMVWYGMVWYGMVWYGMVWYGKTLFKHANLDQRELLFMRGVTQ